MIENCGCCALDGNMSSVTGAIGNRLIHMYWTTGMIWECVFSMSQRPGYAAQVGAVSQLDLWISNDAESQSQRTQRQHI